MNKPRYLAALPAIVALTMTSLQALAEDNPKVEVLREVTLDIDNDGKADRAVLVSDPASIYVGLLIYMADKPVVRKDDLTTDAILDFRSNARGSLVVTYGRGGSNQYETSLTIVHRNGLFLVAGLTKSWDMRSGIGTCDINFLTGKGVASQDLGPNKPIGVRFRPVKLVDWSSDRQPKACGG